MLALDSKAAENRQGLTICLLLFDLEGAKMLLLENLSNKEINIFLRPINKKKSHTC